MLGRIHIAVAVAWMKAWLFPWSGTGQKEPGRSESEIKRLSKKARQNELEPSAYQGGTFTISSGAGGNGFMTPIINPPQNAILGIGRSAKTGGVPGSGGTTHHDLSLPHSRSSCD